MSPIILLLAVAGANVAAKQSGETDDSDSKRLALEERERVAGGAHVVAKQSGETGDGASTRFAVKEHKSGAEATQKGSDEAAHGAVEQQDVDKGGAQQLTASAKAGECPEARKKAFDEIGCSKEITKKECEEGKKSIDVLKKAGQEEEAACTQYGYDKCCGSSCFGGDAVVQTPDGAAAMRSLTSGDLVRTAAGIEPVLGFLHSAPAGGQMLQITHAGGSLHVSPAHLVFKADGASVAARDVVAGDALAPGVVVERVAAAAAADFYAPLTASGTLVVDGIVVSAYATVAAHAAGQAALLPLRYLSAAAPAAALPVAAGVPRST